MDVFINLFTMVLTVCEYISFCYVFFRNRLNKKASEKVMGIAFIIGVILVSGIFDDNDFVIACQIISTFVTVYCIFDVTFFTAVKMWLIAFPVLMMLEYVPFLLCADQRGAVKYIDFFSLILIIAGIWLYYFLALRKYTVDISMLKRKTWIFVSAELFILLALVVSFIGTSGYRRGIDDWQMIVVIIGVVCIVVLNLLLYHNYNYKNYYMLESEAQERYNEHQKEYFEMLLSKEEETRSFRHDISVELFEVKRLVQDGEIVKACDFLEEMNNEIKEIKEKNFTIGNEMVDIILNHYLLPVRDKCDVKVDGVIGNDIDITRRDLCIIISNVINNAVTEVKKINDRGYIIVKGSRGNENILIQVKNTMDKTKILSWDESGIPTTTQIDKKNHGYGLKNVKRIVERNHGFLRINSEGGFFIAEILLKISK